MSGSAPRLPEGTSTPPYRLAIADDDHRVLAALEGLFSDVPEIELRGAFTDGFDLRKCCSHDHLDVALIDVAMPGGGPALARDIRAISPHTIVVVHTAHGDRQTRASMLAAGASMVLEKGRTIDVTTEVLALVEPSRSSNP